MLTLEYRNAITIKAYFMDAGKVLDKEFIKYFNQLTHHQKGVVLNLIKAFGGADDDWWEKLDNELLEKSLAIGIE